MTALAAHDVSVDVRGPDGTRRVVLGVSLAIEAGQVLAVVGESGAGKTMLADALCDLLPGAARQSGGTVSWGEADLASLDTEARRRRRGAQVGYVGAEAALDPCQRVGDALVETMVVHGVRRVEAVERATRLLGATGIPDADQRRRSYPHELSGGMRQRVAIALALANEPDVVVADEPTSALDVTIQAQVLGVLQRLCRDAGVALVLVTHDLGVVAGVADRVAVMYAGRVVESGEVADVIDHARHPYTRGLLAAVARSDETSRPLTSIPGTAPRDFEVPGCPFAPRCAYAEAACREWTPQLTTVVAGHQVACRRAAEIDGLEIGVES